MKSANETKGILYLKTIIKWFLVYLIQKKVVNERSFFELNNFGSSYTALLVGIIDLDKEKNFSVTAVFKLTFKIPLRWNVEPRGI